VNINWKGCGRKRSWPNLGIITTFLEKLKKRRKILARIVGVPAGKRAALLPVTREKSSACYAHEQNPGSCTSETHTSWNNPRCRPLENQLASDGTEGFMTTLTIAHHCTLPLTIHFTHPVRNVFLNSMLSRSMCDYRRGLDKWMYLLTTHKRDLELQDITAPSLISTIHKSSQHPLSYFSSLLCVHQPIPGNGFYQCRFNFTRSRPLFSDFRTELTRSPPLSSR
jgi:hypothetical protein